MRRTVTILSVLLVFIGAFSASGATRTDAVRVQYKNIQIARVIREIGMATGTSFIFGDEVNGLVSITVPKPVGPDEALELLRAALYLKGFVEIPAGENTYKVIPIAATATDSEADLTSLDSESDRVVTTLVELQHVAAADVAQTLRDFVPGTGAVIGYPPTNSLVLSGSESVLRRLVEVTAIIDQAGSEELLALTLRYRSVMELVDIADEVLNAEATRATAIEFWTDERTNMLLARAPTKRLQEVRDFVEEFDRMQVGGGRIQIVRVLNRDPKELADVLLALRQDPDQNGQGTESTSAPTLPVLAQLANSAVGQSLAGRSFLVTADEASRSLILQGDPPTIQTMVEVIEELDRIEPRVSVEVLFYEVQRPSGFIVSLDYFVPVTQPKDLDDLLIFVSSVDPLSGGVPASPSGPGGGFARFARDPVTITITDPTTGLQIPIELPTAEAAGEVRASDVRVDLLIQPNLVVISGEEHELFVGNTVPIPVAAGSQAGAGADGAAVPTSSLLVQRQDILREDVGMTLRVRPTLGTEGTVRLELDLEIADIAPSIAGNVEEVGPTILQRKLQSTAVLRPGESVVLGTHDEKSTVNLVTGVPWLMNVPGLGLFFKRIEEKVMDTQILMVASARVLRSPADDVAETIRRRLAFERSISRVNDLTLTSEKPWAVRLATLEGKDAAYRIADTFDGDGFASRVTRWQSSDSTFWDVYLVDYPDFESASTAAYYARESGWDGEVLIVPTINEMAPRT